MVAFTNLFIKYQLLLNIKYKPNFCLSGAFFFNLYYHINTSAYIYFIFRPTRKPNSKQYQKWTPVERIDTILKQRFGFHNLSAFFFFCQTKILYMLLTWATTFIVVEILTPPRSKTVMVHAVNPRASKRLGAKRIAPDPIFMLQRGFAVLFLLLLSPRFTHGGEPSLLPLSHASSQSTTCNKKLMPKMRITTIYWSTPLKCLHPQLHMGPAKDPRERGRGEERGTRASSWEARGFMLAAAQQAAGTDLPLKLLSNDWLLPVIGFTNNNQVKISHLDVKLCLKDKECCPGGVREEGMLRKGRREKAS